MMQADKKKSFRFSLLSAFILGCTLLSSCGYRYDRNYGLQEQYTSISVPYVDGDQDGTLTAAIIKEIVRESRFRYKYTGGDLTLNVINLDIDEENIGFCYDRKKRGELTQDVIPIESRLRIYVEVWVTDSSGATVLGPVRLSAYVDYDHDYYSSRDGVNIFSLGQLIDLESAYDAVQIPLNREIARKIADYVTQSW